VAVARQQLHEARAVQRRLLDELKGNRVAAGIDARRRRAKVWRRARAR
jgi:hypothetical protein